MISPPKGSLTTHVFDQDSDYLDSDAVFGVKRSLLCRFEQHHGQVRIAKRQCQGDAGGPGPHDADIGIEATVVGNGVSVNEHEVCRRSYGGAAVCARVPKQR